MLGQLARNPTVAIPLSLVILTVAGLTAAWGMGAFDSDPTRQPWPDYYFYDVATGERFAAPGHNVPPFRNSAGNDAVRAYVASCGGEERTYLLKYSDDLHAAVARAVDPAAYNPLDPKLENYDMKLSGALVASGDSPDTWIPFADPEAQAIISGVMTCDGGSAATPVLPPTQP